jgi:hypothetical protein
MTAYIFAGPVEMVFPAYLSPPGSPPGTLVAVPGNTYDFGDDVPPGPDAWWVATTLPASAPAVKTQPPSPPAPAPPAAPSGEGA